MAELATEIRVQFVGEDGCFVLMGHRVRTAPGNGEGSLRDERDRGVTTPLAGDEGREGLLGCVTDPGLRAFVMSLPVARVERREAASSDD